ncbi:DUF6684 family protein [Haloferax sp. DFSO52]|uniref:DUF6684 family protein n=1 Tax=Haloferax sp. DFSO52 TaxID=3388505 RepID=UPI003A896D6D
MVSKTFDKETILDLTVNMVPLVIILFFVVGYAVFNPFGFDSLTTGLQYGIMVGSFVLLAVLTYISGKAIAGSEKTSTVYLPGQATVPGAEPLHGEHEEAAAELEESADGETVESAEGTA